MSIYEEQGEAAPAPSTRELALGRCRSSEATLRRILTSHLTGVPIDREEAEQLVKQYGEALLCLVQEYQSPMWGPNYVQALGALDKPKEGGS